MKVLNFIVGLMFVLNTGAAFAADAEKTKDRKPAMGEPENECVFRGTKAAEWFNQIQKLTPTCGYMSSDTNGLEICGDHMASIMCKKFGSHYKCVASSLALVDPKTDCKGSSLPTM